MITLVISISIYYPFSKTLLSPLWSSIAFIILLNILQSPFVISISIHYPFVISINMYYLILLWSYYLNYHLLSVCDPYCHLGSFLCHSRHHLANPPTKIIRGLVSNPKFQPNIRKPAKWCLTIKNYYHSPVTHWRGMLLSEINL